MSHTNARQRAESAEEALTQLEDASGRAGTASVTTERYHRLAVASALTSIAQSLVALTDALAGADLTTLREIIEPPREMTHAELAALPDGTPIS